MLIISRLDPECIKISAINLLRIPIPSCQHLKKMVGRGGIEPRHLTVRDFESLAPTNYAMSAWWLKKDSNLRTPMGDLIYSQRRLATSLLNQFVMVHLTRLELVRCFHQ